MVQHACNPSATKCDLGIDLFYSQTVNPVIILVKRYDKLRNSTVQWGKFWIKNFGKCKSTAQAEAWYLT